MRASVFQAESNDESIFAQASEARLPDSSSDSESVSSTDNGLVESHEKRELYMISGEHFGSSDITQFSEDLIRLSERLDCLSCGNAAGSDGKILDSIEEDIALISDEIEAILLLPRSQPSIEISNIQVMQHISARHLFGLGGH